MLEEYDLKPYIEVLNDYGLTPEEETGEGLDEIKYYEVYRKGNLVLYEYDSDVFDSVISEEIVNEIFPEFETDSTKGYLIEENGKMMV